MYSSYYLLNFASTFDFDFNFNFIFLSYSFYFYSNIDFISAVPDQTFVIFVQLFNLLIAANHN